MEYSGAESGADSKIRINRSAPPGGRDSLAAVTYQVESEATPKTPDPEVRPGLERAEKGARASGTPFLSFFTPAEMLTLAREAGFREVQHVSAADLAQRYFAGRKDGLRPLNNSEELLVGTT